MQTYLCCCVVALLAACDNGEPGLIPADAGLVDARGLPDSLLDAADFRPCDPLAQTGCAEGEKCSLIPSPLADEAPMVGYVPVTGDNGLNASCTAATPEMADDCRAGLLCTGAGAKAVCLEFCESQPFDTCPAGQVCAFGIDVIDDYVDRAELCAQLCDPVAQDCPPDFGNGCYPSRHGAICAQIGAGEEPVREGEECAFANSCAPGLGCFRIGVSTDWFCMRLCDPLTAVQCTPYEICGTVENETWGICTVPS